MVGVSFAFKGFLISARGPFQSLLFAPAFLVEDELREVREVCPRQSVVV